MSEKGQPGKVGMGAGTPYMGSDAVAVAEEVAQSSALIR